MTDTLASCAALRPAAARSSPIETTEVTLPESINAPRASSLPDGRASTSPVTSAPLTFGFLSADTRIRSPSPTRETSHAFALSATASFLVRNCSSTELLPDPTTAAPPLKRSSAAAFTAKSRALSAPFTRAQSRRPSPRIAL